MLTYTRMIVRFGIAVAIAITIFCASQAQADPIEIISGSIGALRQTQAANDVLPTGSRNASDTFLFSAGIVGGANDIWIKATYNYTDNTPAFSTQWVKNNTLTVAPNLAYIGAGFDSNRLGEWSLSFWRGSWVPGQDMPVSITTPSLIGAESPVPFPTSVTLTGSGQTPTISWTVPQGFTPEAYRVNIYDKETRFPGGQADIIWNTGIDASATSYTIPEGVLSEGGQYSFNLQVIDLRDGIEVFSNNNAEILRRSNSYFDFTPLTGDNPPEVALPSVIDGVYNFDIGEVGPDYTTFIDPFVAIGYEYATGDQDPNFASVELPDVGDGIFTLEYYLEGVLTTNTLYAKDKYFFQSGGVDWFKVTGIETSAGLDPDDVTAFITGLTFVTTGSFTGTMTPIKTFIPDGSPVPEPSTMLLLCFGLVGLTGAARKKMRK
jgi:hypothetical protein